MLGLSPLPRTLAAALRDALHEKLEVRRSALADLARLAPGEQRAEVLAALGHALKDDAAPEVRGAAAVALADARAHEYVAELLGALSDASDHVRQMALLALGEVADPGAPEDRVVEALERAQRDDAPALRFQALIALQRLAPARSAGLLGRALDDDDAQVRYIALRLAEERVEPGSSALPQQLLARARIALSDAVPAVRVAAAILLARAGDRSGGDVLTDAANGDAPLDAEDEQAVIELCGELGLAGAIGGLKRQAFGTLGLRGGRFAFQARVALARLGDARAKGGILRGLEAWTRDARTLAVVAAGQAQLLEARPLLLQMRGDPARADPESVERAIDALSA